MKELVLPSVVPVSDRLEDAATVRLVRASLFVLFSYVFLANSWMGDDAHITFRAVWNLVHGYGFTYNPAERVQAFTHPLWAMVVAAAYSITREFFLTVTALSFVFNVAAGVLVLRRACSLPAAVVTLFWLLSSKALVDYTSSGLEYPLSYFLLALFYGRYLYEPSDRPSTVNELRWYVFVAALAVVNRPDAAVLYVLPLLERFWRTARAHGWTKLLVPVLLGGLPAFAWVAFATFYYGFPLPNTFYAKVANGVPTFIRLQQGVAYLFNSLRFDPMTIGTVALALGAAWRTGGRDRLAALSAALSVVYAVDVGGDFMSGRFFALPFLLAVMTLSRGIVAPLVRPALAVVVAYNLLVPVAPIKTMPGHQAEWPWRTQNGIKDEMGISHADSNLLAFAPFRPLIDTPFGREGLSFRGSDKKVTVYCCIGLYGLNAGPDKFILDNNALSDPFLARLPVSPMVYFDFWASHYFRDLPEGYIESNERNENLLANPLLHAYYDRLRNVTRGPVFRASRLRDIWELNVGRYRRIGDEFERGRPVVLSVRASHERFKTDVGERDPAAGTLRSSGREGYLEFGPGIPLKAGAYRVEWRGSIDAPAGSGVGHVEVWSDDRLLARQHVTQAESVPDRAIAHADFTLSKAANQLEYRFWTNGAGRIVLERIELSSITALQPRR